MEVTKKNFKEILPEVEEAIKSATFVTIDGEFTGLNNGAVTTPYDTPANYYEKIRKGAMDFLLIQFGLCAFKYDEATRKFTHQAYNFYIFPKQCHSSAPDTRFLCQSSSIDFLISNGFDFNKLFRDGIPYLTKKCYDEQEARLKLVQKQRAPDMSPSRGKIVIPVELTGVVQSTCADIEKFLLDEDSENELECPKLNAFVRKLIYQEINAKFPDEKLILDTKVLPDKTHVLVARKGKSKLEFEEERCRRELEELEDAVGFSSVISLLTKHNSMLVGHNMFLDLCHIVNRFCFTLPDNFLEFKSALHCIFPQVFDTKLMCTQPPLRDLITNSALGPLLDIVQKEPFTFVNSDPELPDRGYSISNEKCHEAGYDAYITGLVFLSLSHHLQSKTKSKSPPSPPLPLPLPLSSPLLNQARNKLYLMRLADYPYVNLEAAEPVPDRSHVFVMQFPPAWKTSHLVDVFAAYGPINISWINDASAFIALHRKSEKTKVIKDLILKNNTSGEFGHKQPFRLLTFADFSKDNSSAKLASPAHSKRKRTLSNNDCAVTKKSVPTALSPTPQDANNGNLGNANIHNGNLGNANIDNGYLGNANMHNGSKKTTLKTDIHNKTAPKTENKKKSVPSTELLKKSVASTDIIKKSVSKTEINLPPVSLSKEFEENADWD